MSFPTFLNFFLALMVVLGLIGVLSWVGQRWGGMIPQFGRRRSGSKRIGVVETLYIDGKHRLALLRRDQVEHLVLLDPTGAVVVETNIVRGEGVKGEPGERRDAGTPARRPKPQQKEADPTSWLER